MTRAPVVCRRAAEPCSRGEGELLPAFMARVLGRGQSQSTQLSAEWFGSTPAFPANVEFLPKCIFT